MRKWLWSYAIHVLIWATLAFLALHLKVIAHIPVLIAFLVLSFPRIVTSFLGFGPASYPDAYAIYITLGLVLVLLWPSIAFVRWANGKPALLFMIPHVLIAYGGWWSSLLVGFVNFPFRL